MRRSQRCPQIDLYGSDAECLVGRRRSQPAKANEPDRQCAPVDLYLSDHVDDYGSDAERRMVSADHQS